MNSDWYLVVFVWARCAVHKIGICGRLYGDSDGTNPADIQDKPRARLNVILLMIALRASRWSKRPQHSKARETARYLARPAAIAARLASFMIWPASASATLVAAD